MEINHQQKILDISWGTILRIVTVLAALYFLFLIKDLLVWFIFALVISILFNPAINFLRKRHIPRVLAAILVYFSIFILFGLFLYKIAPFLFSELKEFAARFPEYFEQASPYLKGLKISALESFQSFSVTLESILLKASSNIFIAIGTFFGGLAAAVAIFGIAFFLSLEENGIERVVTLIAPDRHRDKALRVWKRAQRKVSLWFGTRLLACLFVGVTTAVTCYALNIRYAVFFGLLAGVADLIITIGPLMAGGIIAIFAALSSLPQALIFVAAFILIQQIEAHILSPILSKKFLHLSPALVLMAILIGAKLWGLLGALLAIPLMGIVFEFIKGILSSRKEVVQEKEESPSQTNV